jgi:hypothetical protein
MAGQRHDLRRKKWEACAGERLAAEQRRMRRKKLARRKKLRAARQVDPADITTWRDAKRKSGG